MKHIILFILASLFLCTACFEKEEIEKQEQETKEETREEISSLPPEKDILEFLFVFVFLDL